MQVSEAIQERAKRIYDKYGNVMLDVKGMTKAGVERKATCRALFSKLLYLAGATRACAHQLAGLPATISLAAHLVLLDCSFLHR